MIGDIYISDHAVERFVKRHAPEMSFDSAKSLLIRRSLRAVLLRQKTINGDEQWQINDPNVILVGKRVKGKTICVTILPEAEFNGIPEEELELIREYVDSRASSRISETERRCDEIEDQLSQTLTPVQRFELLQQKISAEKKIEATRYQIMREYIASNKEKIETMNNDSSRRNLSKALKIAISALVKLQGDREVDYALAEIQRINASYTSKDFLK
jgi:hypothetical protein